MPSVVRSRMWFCRIDGPEEYLKEKSAQILQWLDTVRLLCAFHEGKANENPHIHFVLELSSELQKQSFDVRLKTLFKLTKASDWSSKSWDGAESACSYLFHENTTPFNNKGFTEEDIQRFSKLNEDVQKVVAVNKEKGPNRSVSRVLLKLQDAHALGDISNATREEILSLFVMDIYEGVMYEPGDFQLKRLVEEVYIKTRKKSDMPNYIMIRYNNLFRT